MTSFPRIPINPRLSFGQPIHKVCTDGRLHPGLKELFTKAYFSAHQNENLLNDEDSGGLKDTVSPGEWVLTILRHAQGTVAVRLALKERLETGRWLLPLQVPPAAPLWLLRHFLGRLPMPLIFSVTDENYNLEELRRKWISLAHDYHLTMDQLTFNQKIHTQLQTKIAKALDEMQVEASLTLISLMTLIRNLSYEPYNDWMDRMAVKMLVEYFASSLVSRPYRPGYLTKDDKSCAAVLCYLCFNLPEVRSLCKMSSANDNMNLLDLPSVTSLIPLPVKHLANHNGKINIRTLEDFKSSLSKSKSSSQLFHPSGIQLLQPQKSNESKEIDKLMSEHAVLIVSTPPVEDGKKLQEQSEPDAKEPTKIVNQRQLIRTENSKDYQGLDHTLETKEPSIGFNENSQVAAININPSTLEVADVGRVHSTLIKTCQALKLAHKLRGQWLAWRLAGIFIDSATSPISGVGYTKLAHESTSEMRQRNFSKSNHTYTINN